MRETLFKHALERLEAAGPEKQMGPFFLPTVNACQVSILTSLKVCDWSGHIFGASASPRALTKKLAMSPSSTVYGGSHDTKYVTFELLMHAAFVADKIWGFTLEPARRISPRDCQPASCWARPVNVYDHLEDGAWIHGVGGERLPAVS